MSHAIEHIPTDMTATVDATMTLAAFQAELARGGQWLPIDPCSHAEPTLANVLAHNRSGPRRFGYGTIRDYTIGMKVRLMDGRTIKTGGKVVKNVAGYDLMKLFIGAGGTIGEIVEATFKLRPRPEAEQFVRRPCASLAGAGAAIDSVLDSPITPTVLDLHNVKTDTFHLVLGFDGTREEVEWQLARARELDFHEAASLDYEKMFRATHPDHILKTSVLPSKLIETIPLCGAGEFVARAGNGVIYSCGNAQPAPEASPCNLFQRVRELFNAAS